MSNEKQLENYFEDLKKRSEYANEKIQDIFNFAVAVSFLIDKVEDVIDDYESDGIISTKQVERVRNKIKTVKEHETKVKEILGIKSKYQCNKR